MKQTVSEFMFRDAFMRIRPDNFSYEGLGAMFEYFEQLEDDLGEEMELDVIAICCDYAEYTFQEAKEEYAPYYDLVRDAENMNELVEAFNEYTMTIPVDDDRLIIAAF